MNCQIVLSNKICLRIILIFWVTRKRPTTSLNWQKTWIMTVKPSEVRLSGRSQAFTASSESSKTSTTMAWKVTTCLIEALCLSRTSATVSSKIGETKVKWNTLSHSQQNNRKSCKNSNQHLIKLNKTSNKWWTNINTLTIKWVFMRRITTRPRRLTLSTNTSPTIAMQVVTISRSRGSRKGFIWLVGRRIIFRWKIVSCLLGGAPATMMLMICWIDTIYKSRITGRMTLFFLLHFQGRNMFSRLMRSPRASMMKVLSPSIYNPREFRVKTSNNCN
jgi:hypothetical protein